MVELLYKFSKKNETVYFQRVIIIIYKLYLKRTVF